MQRLEKTLLRTMQQYNRCVRDGCSIYACIGLETFERNVVQARYSQGVFQVKVVGSTAWLTPSLMWAERVVEEPDLWGGAYL
jgi:hypothetical protein